MKTNIKKLIIDTNINAEDIRKIILSEKTDYNDVAKEICEYFFIYSKDDSNKSKFEIIVKSYCDVILRVLEKTLCKIDMISGNDEDKFAKLFNIKQRMDTLSDNYIEVILADSAYNKTPFLENDTTMDKVDDVLCSIEKKLLHFSKDMTLVSIVERKKYVNEKSAKRRYELQNLYKDREKYCNALATDKTLKDATTENIYLYDAVNSYLYIKCFDENYTNNIDEDMQKRCNEIYIKRRVHQFAFTKDEMYQYIIKPYLNFEDNTMLTREIFQDVGHFVPVRLKNMKHLLYAYCKLCEYNLHKILYSLSSMSCEYNNKAIELQKCYYNLQYVYRNFEIVCSEYFNVSFTDLTPYELKDDILKPLKKKIEEIFYFEAQKSYPETLHMSKDEIIKYIKEKNK